MRPFLRYQVPFLAMCVAIFTVSSLSSVPRSPFPILADKIPHAIVFAVLAVLAFRAFVNQSRFAALASSPVTSAFLFSMFYGAIDEFHQYFVPGRTSDPWDFVADIVGAAIGLMILLLLKRRTRERSGDGEVA